MVLSCISWSSEVTVYLKNDFENSIQGYSIIRRDRNRKCRGVGCYFSNKICYNAINCSSNKMENIFMDLLVQKAKPITAGITWKPPDQLTFLETLSESLNLLNILNEEWHMLGDLNINLYENRTLFRVREKNKIIGKFTNEDLKQKNI